MKSRDFIYCHPDAYPLRKFGFKIHISATSENYSDIFNLVYPFLLKKGICFKYLASSEVVEFNFSDMESPAESGKYFTIYPKDREHCLELLEELYQLFPIETEGIYILSDRAYKDSQVIFYRYGCIELDETNLENGLPTLYGSNGERWQDHQKTYFDLPDWIDDLQEPMVAKDSYLSQQYQVTDLLKQGNGGNVYLARNRETEQEVIIKESKPHITCIDNVKREALRINEWKLSQSYFSYTPQPIETVQEWINQYYIYEYIQGVSLRTYCDDNNLFAYTADKPEENYQKYQKLLRCFRSILKSVWSLHQQGLVLNDIHPDNFIVTDSGEVVFIDLENSYKYDAEALVWIYSEVSLREWNRLDGYVADCHKLGKLFLFLLGRFHNKEVELRKLLLQKGIDSELDNLIDELMKPDVQLNNIIDNFEQLKSRLVKRPVYHLFQTDQTEMCKSVDSLDLTELVLLYRPNIQTFYDCLLFNEECLVERLKREEKLGLNGLTGAIVYLNSQGVNREIIRSSINYLLNQLTTVGGVKGVKVGKHSVSPYLGDGTAGIILLLLDIGEINLAEELAPILSCEFAQFSGIWDGMLGISYTLIRLFEYTQKSRYLEKSKELLISCLLLEQDSLKHCQECLYLLSYYNSVLTRYQERIN